MIAIDPEELRKSIYQNTLNFSQELKKEITDRIQKYGDSFKFGDVFYRLEFARILFDYLDEKIDKDTFKEKLAGRVLLFKEMHRKDSSISSRYPELHDKPFNSTTR